MKRWLVAIVVLTIGMVATIGGVRYYQRHGQAETALGPVTDRPLDRTLKDILDEPIAMSSLHFGATASPVCQEFWRQTLKTRLFIWMTEVDEMGWQHPDECSEEEPVVLSRLVRAIQVNCMKRHPDRKALEQLSCQESLFHYRIKLADTLSADQKNYFDMPLGLLLAKVIGDPLGEEPGQRAPLPDWWAMIDALEKREPDWFPIKKLLVVAFFWRQRVEEDADLRAQIGERLTKAIDAATASNSRDAKILEIELLRQLDSGEEGSSEIEKFAMKYPDSALAQYFWASVLCREGSRAECLSVLEKAVTMSPDEPRFRDTMERVRQTESVTNPALFSLAPRFDIFDW